MMIKSIKIRYLQCRWFSSLHPVLVTLSALIAPFVLSCCAADAESDDSEVQRVDVDSNSETDRNSYSTDNPSSNEDVIQEMDSEAENDSPAGSDQSSCNQVVCDGSGPGPGQYLRWLTFDNRLRNYQLHIPKRYNGRIGVPLVFDLHAHPTTAYIQELLSGFRDKADREGFVVVQPNGVGMGWNAGPKCCGEAEKQNVDDVGFIRAIRDELAKELCLDLDRVYVAGMSSGGYLAHTIACEETDLVAAIGPVASSIAFSSVEECAPSRPIPVAMISGTDDELAEKIETFERWLEINGCSDSHDTQQFGVFTCETYSDCRDGVSTIHCIGKGVGHCWPGTSSSAVSTVYPCTDDLISTDFLWDFFARQRIPN